MNRVTVESFHDSRYSRPRYRLRHSERQTWLHDGFTVGSYKLRRDAEFAADSHNLGEYAARAKRDGRYTYRGERFCEGDGMIGTRWVVNFLDIRVNHASTLNAAYCVAGQHLASRLAREARA